MADQSAIYKRSKEVLVNILAWQTSKAGSRVCIVQNIAHIAEPSL